MRYGSELGLPFAQFSLSLICILGFFSPIGLLFIVPLLPFAGLLVFEYYKNLVMKRLWGMYWENESLKERLEQLDARTCQND